MSQYLLTLPNRMGHFKKPKEEMHNNNNRVSLSLSFQFNTWSTYSPPRGALSNVLGGHEMRSGRPRSTGWSMGDHHHHHVIKKSRKISLQLPSSAQYQRGHVCNVIKKEPKLKQNPPPKFSKASLPARNLILASILLWPCCNSVILGRIRC
jgi:hypothetical protein